MYVSRREMDIRLQSNILVHLVVAVGMRATYVHKNAGVVQW